MLKKEYLTVFTHKGFNIQTQKVAVPATGDQLGYVIDNYFFIERTYDLLQDAAEL
ncbi:hypothetical protein [Paenibacillus donghaensis]|uniref:hypothetical protein n=1 Tax=Paenibacillus donghaensis TaxID=414771 RepID=UPI0012F7800B|nr:hypothetical protein [Paenibacillus donghaensis]